MARNGRPVSESYQPVCSVSLSSEAGTVGLEDEDDAAPIFSLSKSSMDVVMATGPPHKRDPAWTTMDLRRSSSTNTHSENNSVTPKQLHPHARPHVNATNSHQLTLTSQNVDVHSPPHVSERWIANMQRWSECSSTNHSRSSTPDTIVWRDGTPRPLSLTQEATFSAGLDVPMSNPTSPVASPVQTPNSPFEDLQPSSELLRQSTQEDLPVSSPRSPPLASPQQAYTSSLLSSSSPSNLQFPSTEEEGCLGNNAQSFTFPSPLPSSVSLADGEASSDPLCPTDDVIGELHSPGDTQVPNSEGVSSPVQQLNNPMPNSPAEKEEPESSVCHLELALQLVQSFPAGRSWRSPLVCSASDSQLGACCRCKLNTRGANVPNVGGLRDEGTMTSKLELVDVAVQAPSPVSSMWALRRNISSSNMSSHSMLGSPPGSRLNLKSSVGSNSNLVSPSSSMFPVSSGEEEERQGDDHTGNPSHGKERRRSCLKMQADERDELVRRSSMKQVQWDEDGMTWDVHGASPDPEVLSKAIEKHLEVQNSPTPAKRASKKKKAPNPPVISSVVKDTAPELNPPETTPTASCTVEAESEETQEGVQKAGEEEGGVKEETTDVGSISREEGGQVKEQVEVCAEEVSRHPKSDSTVSRQNRKKSVIRSLRPGWCGGSRRKVDD